LNRLKLALPLVLLSLVARAPESRAINLPAGFVAEDVAPGAAFVNPTQVAFLPGGRMLVAEKRGRVWIVNNGVKNATPLWQADNEVLDESDRGLLSIAVDPNYVTNHFVYFLYTVDPDSNGVDTSDPGFGRLTRYTVSFSDSNALVASSRTILMGTTWNNAPGIGSPSHTIGNLRWGRDGSLMVSAGDGAQFDYMDAGGNSPKMFQAGRVDPYEDIGAFRSQSLSSIDGKILRLNPANGHGYASNPFADGNLADKRSKIFEYGLRNPFRFAIRPGTGSTDTSQAKPGTLFIGDVGWVTWEEMNIAKVGGKNFGWPCYEGIGACQPYQLATPPHDDCGSIGTADDPSPVSSPAATWNHTDPNLSVPPGFIGNTSLGGQFYLAKLYPGTYRNKYFFMDYGQNWMKVAVIDSLDNLVEIQPFCDDMNGPVDLELEPVSGNLIYISIISSQVFRIRYTNSVPGNSPPQAIANGVPTVGTAPVNVNFSSNGSNDPDNDPMTFSWNFGDASGSSLPNPSHTYTSPATYKAVLTVTDTLGQIGRDTVTVVVANSGAFPTTGILDNFNRANGAIGGQWTGATTGLSITNNQLTQTCCYATTAWNGAIFGPDQEAYIHFNQATQGAFEHDVLLKIQGTSTDAGHIECRWDGVDNQVTIDTYDPTTTWVNWATFSPVQFNDGDTFGARAYADGTVQVYKNGQSFGITSVAGWQFANGGGRVGLTLYGATSSLLDNFGGGNAVLISNTKPHAIIQMPGDSTFYATGDTIKCLGTGTDAQDPSSALTYRWEMDLHHNTHIHPISEQADSSYLSFLGFNHDDGTGVYFLLRFIVTDTGGLKDTATVNIFPSADLQPFGLLTNPGNPGTANPTGYQFWLRNNGPMPAHISHWRLIADNTTLAEGDTIVAGLDSVQVTVVLPPVLAAGNHVLRVAADTLKTVVETNETNNGVARTITVVNGDGTLGVAPPPLVFALSGATPNPAPGSVTFALQLPAESGVSLDVMDITGRRVWSDVPGRLGPGQWTLKWNGRDSGGAPVHAGVYLARIQVNGRSYVRRVAMLR